ncbi:protein-glutamate O-methyltransferase CheR [Georgenia wutianyii]|uniref:protein-glutamate O-methyltransferase n=1 Tax=Georgenia wutianyii TaxID=2585135 RepID=A0ABX5VK57_9MICO|nr:protein-glutamate O-methyltransferase CheR [Georgenia wutianyii]QDB78193.1 protein-glutamate O-methyltransferase CheR [Georgenia wutianyii]
MSVSAQTFDYVADLVRTRSAIQLGPGKEYLVESRLAPLARERGMVGPAAVDAYVRDVRRGPDRGELTRVVEALTTNETSWFRDSAAFGALRTHLLPGLRAQRPGPLRIWSAACSTGQEPYSIAMTLLEAGETRFSVLATDLSTAVLAQATRGEYSQLEMNRGLPAPMLVRHFARAGAGWAVKDELRRRVGFAQHNLLQRPPPGPFDVVFLRNVLIYFDTTTKRDIVARVRRAMRPGGFLILGAAESMVGIDDAWERVTVTGGPVYRAPGGTP